MSITIIPAIDLLDKKVVRLKQGRYDDVTFYDYTPVELAQQFEQAGASRLHIVDLNGARDGSIIHGELIQSICNKTKLTIEVGGGIRTKQAAQFYFNSGVDQVILGSLFINNFELASQLAYMYPNQIIAGVDAKQDHVATDGWESTSNITLNNLLGSLNNLPLHSIIYTDIAKDGMLQGPNLSMLSTVAKLATHPIIASGGIRNQQDVSLVKKIHNVSGCIVGKAILNDLALLNLMINC